MPSLKNKSVSAIDSEKLLQKIGGRLTDAWKRSGLTKAELAKQANMSRMSVTKILQGTQLPQLPALYVLCDILREEIAEVLPPLKEITNQSEEAVILPEGAKALLSQKTIRALEGKSEA